MFLVRICDKGQVGIFIEDDLSVTTKKTEEIYRIIDTLNIRPVPKQVQKTSLEDLNRPGSPKSSSKLSEAFVASLKSGRMTPKPPKFQPAEEKKQQKGIELFLRKKSILLSDDVENGPFEAEALNNLKAKSFTILQELL